MQPRKDPAWYLAFSREHVAYEFYMLRKLALRTPPSVEEDRVQRFALIEAFAMHLRNVIDFFAGPWRKDDVGADDYVREGTWDGTPYAIDPLRALKRRADKEIAHLTSDRTAGEPKAKEWEPIQALSALGPAARTFLRDALPDSLDGRARSEIQKLLGPYGPEADDPRPNSGGWVGATMTKR